MAHGRPSERGQAPISNRGLAPFSMQRLERAIGVIYRPESELASHYFEASLPQFDEWIWFDETRAVDAVPVRSDDAKVPETFPFGV